MAALDFSAASGLFTEAYSPALKLIVEGKEAFKLQKMIPFKKTEKLGNQYHLPVVLTREAAIAFSSSGGAITLATPYPATYADATIRGAESVLASDVAYSVLSRAGGGVKQFVSSMERFVKNNVESHAFHTELSLLYGQSGIADTTEITASGTAGTFTVSVASWAPGLWKDSVGMALDIYATTGSASPINTNALIRVTSVNISTRVVSFSCASGDASALEAASTGVVFRYGTKTGASTYATMAGLDSFFSASTLFGISTSTYANWKPVSVSAGSASLTLAKVQEAMAAANSNGLMGDTVLLCNPATWGDVMSDLAALRRFNGPQEQQGGQSIRFDSQVGSIEFVPHIYVKQGEAFIVAKDNLERVGSMDISIEIPMVGGQALQVLEGSTAVRFRTYTDQALFSPSPGGLVKITGIVNG